MALGSVGPIAKEFENVNSALMVAPLGGATGSGVSPIVAGALKEMELKLDIIVQIPFPFEGKKTRENALESLNVIQQYADNVIVVEGIGVLKKHGKEMTLLDAFKAFDLEMASHIKGFYGNDPK
jgi:cell division GTPase FtsZ